MDNVTLIRMEAGNVDDVRAVLSQFTEQYNECFDFKSLEKDNIVERLWKIIFKYLNDPQAVSLYPVCLHATRILSRDKTHLEKFVNEQRIGTLLQHAALKGQSVDKLGSLRSFDVIVEALKCLCNLAYNCPKVQTICSGNGTLDGIVRRLRMHPDANLPHPVKYFDVKLLFLISALSADVRPRLREELHALTYLMEALDFILKEGGGYSQDNQLQYFPALDENAVELSCEILKVLFNLTVKVLSVGTEEEFERSDRLITILRELLLSSTPPHMHDSLVRHIINLLTNMPHSSYEMLMPPEEVEYNGEAIDVIIKFLDRQLSNAEGLTYENLSPALIVLTEGCRAHKILRKHVRNQVLPPLRDVKTKPEEGTKIRNKLCRLLTDVNTNLRDLVAEFLFVLCKENVNRLIKYTGFGNAAGMFATRNLLTEAIANADYSSDSENSETEEYLEYKDKINPVTGCYEPPKPSALESMSEEQKEYEVMKLVSAMDKLQRSGNYTCSQCARYHCFRSCGKLNADPAFREGIVQPCRIGEDGKPVPFEHILQLQEEIPKQQVKQ